jgi:hypothetical protein
MDASSWTMRRLVLTLLIVASLAAPELAGATSRPMVGDWLLIRVESGDQPSADSSAGAQLLERSADRGPVLSALGYVWWFERRVSAVSVFTPTDTTRPVEVRSGTASLSLSVASPLGSGDLLTGLGGAVPAMPAHAVSYLLYFTTNASFRVVKTVPARGLKTTFIVGRGSRAVELGGNQEGVAASIGPVGAAVLAARSDHVRAGVVGATSLSPLLVESLPRVTSWAGPGVSGSETCVALVACGTSFAGPAGRWSFSWSGARNDLTQTPSVAAYAPIGPAWRDFRAVR